MNSTPRKLLESYESEIQLVKLRKRKYACLFENVDYFGKNWTGRVPFYFHVFDHRSYS